MASPYFSAHAPIVPDGLAEGEAEVGEPVLDTGRHFRKVAADDDAIAFQSAQRPGEHWAVTPGATQPDSTKCDQLRDRSHQRRRRRRGRLGSRMVGWRGRRTWQWRFVGTRRS